MKELVSEIRSIIESARTYQLYLPTKQQLIAEVEKVKKEWEEAR